MFGKFRAPRYVPLGYHLAVAVLVAAALIALGGCAQVNYGHQIADAQLAAFTDGSTTLAEVTAALGPPLTDVNSSAGVRVLGYSWTSAKAGPFQPVTGGSQTVTFQFDGSGVLVHRTVMSARYGG